MARSFTENRANHPIRKWWTFALIRVALLVANVCGLFALCLLGAGTAEAEPTSYQDYDSAGNPFDVTLFQGDDSFADVADGYNRNGDDGSGEATVLTDRNQALGPPNETDPNGVPTRSVSLGDGGSIILRFQNNVLRGNGVTGDNAAGADIYVFETGSNTELVDVQLAAGSPTTACPTTAASYTTVGRTTKDYGGVDIDDNGYGPSTRIFCVRIVDVVTDLNNTSAGYHGAEIDAVGARSTYLQGDLSVSKSASPASANVGQNVTYTITGSNLGPGAVNNATITDNLPANTTLVSATASQGACSGTTTVTCNFGTLNGGASATATIVVRPTADAAGTTLSNTATISHGATDSDTSNNTSDSDPNTAGNQPTTTTVPNRAPTADNDSYSVNEDATLTVNVANGVLNGDSDPDGNPISVGTPRPTSDTSNGTLTLNADGSFAYTPNPNFNGTDSFTYRACDDRSPPACSSPATVTITVNPVNDPPAIDLNGAAAGTGYNATFTEDGGSVSIVDAVEPDALTVTDVDNANLTSAAVTLTNRPDGNSAESLDADTSGTTIAKTYNPTTGELRLTGVAPKEDYERVLRTVTYNNTSQNPSTTDRSVTFVVNDGTADSNTATSTVSVVATNDAPTVALEGDGTAGEGETKTYNFTVTDPDSGGFTLASGFPDCGAGGTFVEGSLTTDSDRGSFQCSFPDGPASPTVRIQVTDPQGAESNVATRDVQVNNVAPSISLSGPSTAEEGDTKTYTFTVTDPGYDTHTITTHCGENGIKVDESYDSQTRQGSFRCRFPNGPSTTNVTARVTDSDGANDSDNQVVVVTVANVAPEVVLTGDDSAEEGDTKTYTYTVTDPGDPSPAVEESCGDKGVYIDTAEPNSFQCRFPDGPATSTISVTVTDSDGDSGSDSVQVTVANIAPGVELNGDGTASEGNTKTYTFTVSDSGNDTFSVAGGYPECGTVGVYVAGSLSTNPTGGSFECRFPDGPATTTVAVKVEDSDGTPSNEATRSVVIYNDAPVANDDAYNTDEDTQLTVPAPGVLVNDTDVEGDPLTAVLESGPSHGTLTLEPDGSFTYTPNAEYSGPDSFTYRACDDDGDCSAPATVGIEVAPVNDGTDAVDDAATTDEDDPVNINVLGNDTDPDDDALIVESFTQPENGTVTRNADGTLRYAPDANFNGTDVFRYTISDGSGGTDTAEVTVTVNAVNDAPVADDDAATTGEDTAVVIDVKDGDTPGPADESGQSLTLESVTNPAHGTAEVITTGPDAGKALYTPDANYNGSDTFEYTVCDEGTPGRCDTATVTVTVTPVNDAPVAANDDFYSTDEDTQLTVDPPGVLANDTDADPDPLTARLLTGPQHGVLDLRSDGSFTYTPNNNFSGTDTFTYRATDGPSESDEATVTITVRPVNDPPDDPSAELSLSIDAEPEPVTVGKNLTYTLNVENAGPDTATGVVVRNVLPQHVTFVSASDRCAYKAATRTVTCEASKLRVGASVTMEIVVRVKKAGGLRNTATVSSAVSDPEPANNSGAEYTTAKAAGGGGGNGNGNGNGNGKGGGGNGKGGGGKGGSGDKFSCSDIPNGKAKAGGSKAKGGKNAKGKTNNSKAHGSCHGKGRAHAN